MEISCSNRDENEFAVVISSDTFVHRRGSSRRRVCVWRGSFPSLLLFHHFYFFRIFTVWQAGQHSPLSTPQESSATACQRMWRRRRKCPPNTSPPHSPYFLVWRAGVTMATWHYTGGADEVESELSLARRVINHFGIGTVTHAPLLCSSTLHVTSQAFHQEATNTKITPPSRNLRMPTHRSQEGSQVALFLHNHVRFAKWSIFSQVMRKGTVSSITFQKVSLCFSQSNI